MEELARNEGKILPVDTTPDLSTEQARFIAVDRFHRRMEVYREGRLVRSYTVPTHPLSRDIIDVQSVEIETILPLE